MSLATPQAEYFHAGDEEAALEAANEIVENKSVNKETLATAYYLRGNAYRQNGNVRMALNSYLEAMDLDPNGPAAEAYRYLQELLDYYHKDYYNPIFLHQLNHPSFHYAISATLYSKKNDGIPSVIGAPPIIVLWTSVINPEQCARHAPGSRKSDQMHSTSVHHQLSKSYMH